MLGGGSSTGMDGGITCLSSKGMAGLSCLSSTGMDGGMTCLSGKGMAGLSSMGMEEGGRVQGGALQGKTGPDLG